VLDNKGRTAIADYLLFKSKPGMPRLATTSHFPAFARAHKQLLPIFEQYVVNDLLTEYPKDLERVCEFFAHCPDPKHHPERKGWFYDKIRDDWTEKEWKSLGTGRARWEKYKNSYNKAIEDAFEDSIPRAKRDMDSIVLSLIYPRFDLHVTPFLDHLIRCPFSVHGSTGRFVVPLSANPFKFDPTKVPTLESLMQEFASSKDMTPAKSSLGPYQARFLEMAKERAAARKADMIVVRKKEIDLFSLEW
jgi:DNA primase catalytic subunit